MWWIRLLKYYTQKQHHYHTTIQNTLNTKIALATTGFNILRAISSHILVVSLVDHEVLAFGRLNKGHDLLGGPGIGWSYSCIENFLSCLNQSGAVEAQMLWRFHVLLTEPASVRYDFVLFVPVSHQVAEACDPLHAQAQVLAWQPQELS